MPLQATSGAASYDGFGGGPAAVPNYIEDVFSTWLYPGNSSTQTITNGIDLTGKGGMVWIKVRNSNYSHRLTDSSTSFSDFFASNENVAKGAWSGSPPVFQATSSGFNLNGNFNQINVNTVNYASWTFRKQPKFFDVVTYTGNGSTQAISHNLGSVPGCIIAKRTNTTGSWRVFHRSVSTQYGNLNSDGAFQTTSAENVWGNNSTTVAPTSTEFTVGNDSSLNASGSTYVAYLFAHDAGGFGLTGTDNVISCGSFTTDAGARATVNLGWEPQYLITKCSSSTGGWNIIDSMRGFTVDSGSGTGDAYLQANSANAESSTFGWSPTATGFEITGGESSAAHIYIAIRRGPMKTPTTGTSVFYPQAVSQTDTPDSTNVPFPPDLVNTFSRNGTNRTSRYDQFLFVDRMRGLGTPNNTFSTYGPGLVSSNTDSESGNANSYVQLKADSQNITRGGGWNLPDYGNWIYYFMRRAPGFFDVVCYTGNGTAGRTVTHNLGVAPELMIVKNRTTADSWAVYSASLGATKGLYLNGTDVAITSILFWNNTAPTSTVFSVSSAVFVNQNNANLVAYLFASVPGVSKVGSYTGNGSSQTINCGFTGGARFILIKATSTTGSWWVWDSARGIVAGSDPYLALNSTAPEGSGDDIDAASTGFIVNNNPATTDINANGVSYIFLAIA